ncbi:MAG: L-lactate dehydrogenase [Clostridia bacterium]|nr:L-lactate dehydrogenase [Clostridia bacterium]
MSKVAIIGTGNVGSTIAYTLAVTGAVSEVVMIDLNHKKALGEAMDIRQGTPFCAPISIYAGDYDDAAGADVVVIACGIARRPGQTRLELAQTNVDILKDIIPEITRAAPNAVYILVSNPVDILTYVFCRCSNIPPHRIIGSGTVLDTSRLRTRLSEYYDINQSNVHAVVLGEHGDTSFVPWSQVTIANVPIAQFGEAVQGRDGVYPELDRTEVEEYVRRSGSRVIERKGSTFYAVSAAVCHICKSLRFELDTTMTVSTLLEGEYGISDVCLSTMNAINIGGVSGKIIQPLTDAELEKLHHSADTLKATIAALHF